MHTLFLFARILSDYLSHDGPRNAQLLILNSKFAAFSYSQFFTHISSFTVRSSECDLPFHSERFSPCDTFNPITLHVIVRKQFPEHLLANHYILSNLLSNLQGSFRESLSINDFLLQLFLVFGYDVSKYI